MEIVTLSISFKKEFVLFDGFVWIRSGSDFTFYGSIKKWRDNTPFNAITLTKWGLIAKGVKDKENELETEKEVLQYIKMAKEGALY